LFASLMLVLMQRSATLSHRLSLTLPLIVKFLQLPDTSVSSNRDVVLKISSTSSIGAGHGSSRVRLPDGGMLGGMLTDMVYDG
jgi:hypothetical protein